MLLHSTNFRTQVTAYCDITLEWLLGYWLQQHISLLISHQVPNIGQLQLHHSIYINHILPHTNN